MRIKFPITGLACLALAFGCAPKPDNESTKLLSHLRDLHDYVGTLPGHSPKESNSRSVWTDSVREKIKVTFVSKVSLEIAAEYYQAVDALARAADPKEDLLLGYDYAKWELLRKVASSNLQLREKEMLFSKISSRVKLDGGDSLVFREALKSAGLKQE